MYIHFLYNNLVNKHQTSREECNMPNNEQHLRLVLAACQAKRAADMKRLVQLAITAFSFGTGCALVWILLGTFIAILS